MIDTPANQAVATEPETDRTARRVWWIVGGLATGILLLSAATVLGVWLWTVAPPEKADSHREEYPRAVDGVNVSVEVGDVELHAADGTALEVLRETRWRGSEPEAVEEWQGNTFSAFGGCDEDLSFWPSGDACQVDYTLGLPSGTAAEVENSVGDIRLEGLDGEVDLRSDVGDIVGADLRTAAIDAESSVGTVRLEFAEVRGDITATTSTGAVEIIVPDDGTTFAVVFESGVGSQHIDIGTTSSSRADYVITVSTSVGDLTVRYAD